MLSQSCCSGHVFDAVICKTSDAPLQDELPCWTCVVHGYFYWLLLFYATSMPLRLCVWLLTAHYTTVIMLEASSKPGKWNDLYFQVTGDMWLTLN